MEVPMFQIERKLFFRSKKTLVTILGLLACILLSSFLAGYQNRQAKLKVIHHYEEVIQNFNNARQDIVEQYKNQLINKEDYDTEWAFFTDYIATYQKEIEAVKKEDWSYFCNKNIQHYLREGQYITYAYESYEFTPQTIENTVLISNYLLDHELPTAFPTELFLTSFESPKTPADAEIVANLGQQALKGGSHEIWKSQKNWGVILSTLFFLFCFADFFIKDQVGNKRQVRLLQTLGLSNLRMTCNKYLAFLLLYSFLFLSIYLLHFGVASLLNGTSSWMYPITTYTSKSLSLSMVDIAIQPIYRMVLLGTVLHYLYLLFLLGVAQTLAKLFQNELAGAIATVGIVVSASFYPNIFNPFSLWNAGNLADGSVIIYNQLPSYTIIKAVLILCCSICVIYSLQFYLLTRKREV